MKTGGRRNRDRVAVKFWCSRAARARIDQLAATRRVPRSEMIRLLLAKAIEDA